MKNTVKWASRAGALVAGGLLVVVGGYILASPDAFFQSNGIELGGNVSLTNEMKAPAGFLVMAGGMMLASLWRSSMMSAALGLGSLVYLSYAGSRFFSMAVDGLPATGLIEAAVIETVIGLGCLGLMIAVVKNREPL